MKEPSWQHKLQSQNNLLKAENYELRQRIDLLTKNNTFLDRLSNGPPTTMIACEKIVEAATQLVVSANQMIEKAQRR